MRNGRSLALLGTFVLMGWAAAGQAQSLFGDRGPYVGVSLGSFSYEQRASDGFALDYSDHGSDYRLFAGYQINSAYAIEAGWAKAGDFGVSFPALVPAGEVQVNSTANYRISTLQVLAFAPFSSIRMFGGIGYYHAELHSRFSIAGAPGVLSQSLDLSGGGATVVGGVQFDMRHISIRGDYQWLHTKNLPSGSSINIGVLHRF